MGRTFRRFRRRHKHHKDKKHVPTFDEKIRKIGDDGDIPLGYAWSKVPPLREDTKWPRPRDSLKAICAATVADNIDSIESFDDIPWSCWLLVWNWVLAQGTDSFRTFCIFASKLMDVKGFRCQERYDYDELGRGDDMCLKELRRKALDQTRVPFLAHRIENFFANTFVSELSSYIHGLTYSPNVLLDVSLVNLEDYFGIFNISNLLALNVGPVNDSFLYNLGTAIANDGKLQHLLVLRLSDGKNITEKAVLRLLEVINGKECCLEFIQTDFQLPKTVLKDTNWIMMDIEADLTNLIAKLPLGLKIYMIQRYKAGDFDTSKRQRVSPYDSNGPFDTSGSSDSSGSSISPTISLPPLLRKNILLDIMIHDKSYNENEPNEDIQAAAWTTRIQQRSSQRFPGYIYMLKKSTKVDQVREEKKAPTKRIKRLKPNAKKFFSI